jgi:hypothetical protein
MGLLSTPIKGTLEVTDKHIIVEADLGLLNHLLPEKTVRRARRPTPDKMKKPDSPVIRLTRSYSTLRSPPKKIFARLYKSEQRTPLRASTIPCWIARKTISARRQGGPMGGIPQLAIFLISTPETDLALEPHHCCGFHSVAFMATDGRKLMSKKAAEHHHKAAEHHEHAAKHHKEAAKHHEAGKHETAAHHAHLARGHHEHAKHHAAEAAKAHIEEHGKAIPAHA